MVSKEKERLPVRVQVSRRLNVFALVSPHNEDLVLGLFGQWQQFMVSTRFTFPLVLLPLHFRCTYPFFCFHRYCLLFSFAVVGLKLKTHECTPFKAYACFRFRLHVQPFVPLTFPFLLDLYSTKPNLTRQPCSTLRTHPL